MWVFKEELKYEIRKLSQILIKQNYFQHQDTLYVYIQEEASRWAHHHPSSLK
jgi:hypothetical protein